MRSPRSMGPGICMAHPAPGCVSVCVVFVDGQDCGVRRARASMLQRTFGTGWRPIGDRGLAALSVAWGLWGTSFGDDRAFRRSRIGSVGLDWHRATNQAMGFPGCRVAGGSATWWWLDRAAGRCRLCRHYLGLVAVPIQTDLGGADSVEVGLSLLS